MRADNIKVDGFGCGRLNRPNVCLQALLLLLAFIAVGPSAASQGVLLDNYPLISQKDPAAYRDQALLLVEDTMPGGGGKTIVPNLACAATVYTMLERGRGNSGAMIDDFYQDPRKFNGNGPGAKRPSYVGSDVAFDAPKLIAALKSGQPVILHGFGGPLKEHFVLAVGFDNTIENAPVMIVLDPYPGNDLNTLGRKIDINLAVTPPTHPILKEIVFRQMRFVSKADAQPSGLALSVEHYETGLKDGSVLVGQLQLRELEFKTSYGGATISLRDLLSYKEGFLVLRDGTKLKGSFPANSLALQTSRGLVNLPVDLVVSISLPSASEATASVAVTPIEVSTSPQGIQPAAQAPRPMDNAPNLSGRVFSCFGQPLAGVSVQVKNTRFATLTDAAGNYSVSYVPGTLKVSYEKQGYYPVSLDLQIATSAAYPVQDQHLFKFPPGKGIYFVGNLDYVPLKESRVAARTVENKGGGSMLNPERESAQNIFTVSGQPTIIQKRGDLVFVDSDQKHNSFCRIYTGQEFYRRRMFGIGIGFKHEYEQMAVTEKRLADGVLERSLVLSPGDYILVSHVFNTMEESLQMSVGGTIGEPAYFFRVVGN
jgi:hypothetical protein